jgi:small nuclear ribonucleoprotein D3
MTSTIGIPIKLLNEAAVREPWSLLCACTNRTQGHIVTLEITSGEVYRGKLIEGTRRALDPTLRHTLTKWQPRTT